MLHPGSLALTLLLSMLAGLGPLSVDMYLASLPSIGRLLNAPTSQVQLTISAYLIGFACAQVFYGPLSDRHGRRPVLIAALGIYLLATLACALAFSIETLIAAVLQTAFGWRSNFAFLFCFGAAAWIMVWFLLPETLRKRAPEPVSIASTVRSYRRFLADRGFVIHLGIATCCLCGLFAWISSGAFVLQDIYGLSPMAF